MAEPVAPAADIPTLTAQSEVASGSWQAVVAFPDWMNYVDDTLAMNSRYGFVGFHDQGWLRLQVKEGVTGFALYVNGTRIDTSHMVGGGDYQVDVSAATVDGTNTLQVSNIEPFGLDDAVTVCIPYPEVLAGVPEREGISRASLAMISDLIETDVDNGFTSAQLAVVRNGRVVYEGAWGRINSYLPDGTPNATSPRVTPSTLYDLASNTKMYTVNYALQKLVTDGAIDLDARIVDFLGARFADDTILAHDADGNLPTASLAEIKQWKSRLTIRDLLRHQGGFPADPKYPMSTLWKDGLAEGEAYQTNDLYTGADADEATRKKTIEAICKTPLDYEPGTKTVYSDVDYMVLGLIVEKVTGLDLNTYLAQTFWRPLGLNRITYNPLKAGLAATDCAATELNGNTRDGLLSYPGFRTTTIQGEVHDEKAYYSMMGTSGHAGLFANATDLAKLASLMLTGGYGQHRFFSTNVLDAFTAPKATDAPTWGLGWWRQADQGRPWYFGTSASRDTIGHQGWTGTLTMVDPSRNLVIVYLTNKINSPVTDNKQNPNKFDGNWYTASTLGFVPEILSVGMDSAGDVSGQLLDLAADMATESLKLIPDSVSLESTHPSVRNAEAKRALFEKMAKSSTDTARVQYLRNSIEAAWQATAATHTS